MSLKKNLTEFEQKEKTDKNLKTEKKPELKRSEFKIKHTQNVRLSTHNARIECELCVLSQLFSSIAFALSRLMLFVLIRVD